MKHRRVENDARDFSNLAGAIFMASGVTRKECFKLKLFGLPSSHAGLVKRIKAGMILFLFDYDERKLYGVFEATSDGSMNIMPDAYASTGMQFPAQIQFKIIWKCSPMKEDEFRDSIIGNYFTPNKFNFDLSFEQVMALIGLFSSKRCTSPSQHVHLNGKKHIKRRGNFDTDMDIMAHQSCHIEIDESENSRYNTGDSKSDHHTIENEADFFICSKSHFQTIGGSKVDGPGQYAENFYTPHPRVSDFTDYTYRSISNIPSKKKSVSNIPGEFPTSSAHLHHDCYLPSYLHLPTMSKEVNPLSSTLSDYRKSALETNSQYLGDLPYLAHHDSRTELPPSAHLDINGSMSYKEYRGLSNPICEYSPASLAFAGSQSQGCDNLRNSDYKCYPELCDHSALQDVVSSPRMLLSKGTDSLISILGESNDVPRYQSSPRIHLTRVKDSLKSNLGEGSSSVFSRTRPTKESSRDLYNCNNYPCLPYDVMPEKQNMINYFKSSDLKTSSLSDLKTSSFRNSSLLWYNYPQTFEDCKDYKNENVGDGMAASVILKDSEKNPCLLNFTDIVPNGIQHCHTSQDEQEEYIPYPHRLLDNHHRRHSVFSRLSNVKKPQELEELAHEPTTNPSVTELAEIMELRRKKWISTSSSKKTISQYIKKSQEFHSLEDSVHDPNMNPSTDELADIMELRRKKWGSNIIPRKKIINEDNTKTQECITNEANKLKAAISLTGKQPQERLPRKIVKSQECVSPEKLYSVDPLGNLKPQPESVPETVELPFLNFKRKSFVSKASGETQQTTQKRRKLVRPSFIQEGNMNKGNTESPHVPDSSGVIAGARSFLLAEEVHWSNPVGKPVIGSPITGTAALVGKPVIESLENTATEEPKPENDQKLALSVTEEVILSEGDSKNSNLLDPEEVGDGIGHEFQRLPLRPLSQSPKNNAINEGYKKATLFRSPLSKENCENFNISGSSEEVTSSGPYRMDMEVWSPNQIVSSTRPSSCKKETLTTGDNNCANNIFSQRATPDDDLAISDHEKIESGEGTHERRKFVFPCLNEEDKLRKGHSKCSDVLGSSEVVAESLYEVQRSILVGNPLIEGSENTENENTSPEVGLGSRGSAQLKNVETSVTNENIINISNELGASISVMHENVIGAAKKLKEKPSNLVDRSGTEADILSDGSPTVVKLDTSMAEKPFEVSKEHVDTSMAEKPSEVSKEHEDRMVS